MSTPLPSTTDPSIAGTAVVAPHAQTHLHAADDELPLRPFEIEADTSPPQLTTDTNDYNPVGAATANVWRVDLDAPHNLTGIANGSAERLIALLNISASNSLTLKHESASSLAANRFTLVGGQDQLVPQGGAVILRYDMVSSRWHMVSYVYDLTAVNSTLTTLLGDIASINTQLTSLGQNAYGKVVLTPSQQLTSNSTAFQSIIGQKITGVANGIYEFTMRMVFTSSVTAKFKYQFTIPAGALLLFSTSAYSDATGTLVTLGSALAGTPFTANGTGGNLLIVFFGQLAFGSTPGDMQFQAAQNVATAELTDFVVAGTNISWRQLL